MQNSLKLLLSLAGIIIINYVFNKLCDTNEIRKQLFSTLNFKSNYPIYPALFSAQQSKQSQTISQYSNIKIVRSTDKQPNDTKPTILVLNDKFDMQKFEKEISKQEIKTSLIELFILI